MKTIFLFFIIAVTHPQLHAQGMFDKIKKAAAREVSWLPAAKYSFAIITNENLEVLKINKDITGYKALLNKQYPGRF